MVFPVASAVEVPVPPASGAANVSQSIAAALAVQPLIANTEAPSSKVAAIALDTLWVAEAFANAPMVLLVV
jgi:hypothetical protein